MQNIEKYKVTTFKGHIFVCFVELIMPTFLLKCLKILHAFWIENSIQIYINQVVEILNSWNSLLLYYIISWKIRREGK